MCPVCIAAAKQAAIGATSATVSKKLRTKFTATVVPELKIAGRMTHE